MASRWKCRGGSRVGQVIGRHIDRLYACDGALLRRGNPLLEFSHLIRQCRLVADRRRHTSKQGRNLGTRLYKTENIINKQKYILMLPVTEIFSHRKTCFRNPHTRSRRLIHLSEYQGGLFENT